MANQALKTIKRTVRRRRIRAKVKGTAERPRVSVFKSNKFIYAQIIDDAKGVTLASVSGKEVKSKNKSEEAVMVGTALAKKAVEKKIDKVVFDRGGYIFTGRVAELAKALREGGLKF